MDPSTVSLSAPLPQSLPADWRGYEHIAEQVASQFSGDFYTLKQMSLTCHVFASAARKFLFQVLELMEDLSVWDWQLRLVQSLATHGPHSSFQPFFFHVQDLAFCLTTETHYNEYLVALLDSLKSMLPVLRTIRVYGYDGLVSPWPGPEWFVDFVTNTRPKHLHFNGTLVPNYVLDFNLPGVKTIHFNVCHLSFCHDEDRILHEQQEPPLDVKLVLAEEGEKWARVRKIVSGSINCEMVKVVSNASNLEVLSFRVSFGRFSEPRDLRLPCKLRFLSLQIPNSAIFRVPSFLKYLIEQGTTLNQLDLYYEIGWRRVLSWELIYHYTLSSVLPSGTKAPSNRIRKVNFLFGGLRHLL